MYFDFRRFFHAAYLSVFKWREIPAPLNAKRVVFLFLFFTGYPLFQIFNAICFKLDDLFFPNWRKIELQKPVFIVGTPRSGTTFIHRVMAKDEKQFFCFRTWEIFFPAIVQKKVLSLCGRIDQFFGGVVKKRIIREESKLLKNINKMHHLGLFYPEEDDKLTAHIFSSMDILWFFPFPELTFPLSRFDRLVSPRDRHRIMMFYKDCVKRQAYVKGNRGHLLSKNPVCPPKIQSLYEYFPGCSFIWPVRNPLEVVPSMVNMAHEMWRAAIDLEAGFPFQDMVYDTLKFFYHYPLEQFQNALPDSFIVVNYNDLTTQPSQVVKDIYNHLGFELSHETFSVLKDEDEKASTYKSMHRYSLDNIHITPEEIVTDLKVIFKRFGFDTGKKTTLNTGN